MLAEQKKGGEKRQRRNRGPKDLAATCSFWMPDLESEGRRLETSLARKFRGAEVTVQVERGHLHPAGRGAARLEVPGERAVRGRVE
jgi:hypothetical protein